MGFFKRLFDRGHGVDELARRLEMDEHDLCAYEPTYNTFDIPKRSGGTRRIDAPTPTLKSLQRRLLRRVLARLRCHPNVTGFERRHSIVTNAVLHTKKAVVVRLDIRDFFASTSEKRIRTYFRRIGWNRDAAKLLTKLTTYEGRLPQGAPTSPRLSNLVNWRMDARLVGLATLLKAVYTRYADDLTFSFEHDKPATVRHLINSVRVIVYETGYRLHRRKKMHIRRSHQQQYVTGLVVNEQVNLPRVRRRWLRAVEHRIRTGQSATLTPEQFAGWRALRIMIARQSSPKV